MIAAFLTCKDACGCRRSDAEHSVREIKKSQDKRIMPLLRIVSVKDRKEHRVVCVMIAVAKRGQR